ncbi:hypothetical protein ORM30_25455 [Bacillus cereus]|uniref:hypothetical protein n=1 Tax=Bacillus cereus TaxID=1396 RepID=UPI001FF5BE57|nr:hypothetical protein [Bacillus cereus]MDZ4443768.1 hypothetical protein [Bacillus cereus]UOX99181.1 hypothetical protein MWG54_29365 [Bacillus cereus]
MDARKERIYLISFILLIVLICSSVIIIGAAEGKYGVFLLLAILFNTRITKEFQKKYKQYFNKGRI